MFHTRWSWLMVVLGTAAAPNLAQTLPLSIYATAGDVQRHLSTPEQRAHAAGVLAPLPVTRMFLEGRRGDEYVPPALLGDVRDFLQERGIRSAGAIATVPGSQFGTRQNEGLGWLNWESAQTQREVARFFTENAPLFEELIVDDFYCTGDTSAESAAARGARSWGEYRRDLLVSLIEPMIRGPARAAHPGVRLILKYPQWYDRFHLFGYDPVRMSPQFEEIWVGTEVRDPQTRRMGFVQPTQGYMNFLWLESVAGPRVRGAWFDHIECTAQHFVDQAYLSVLAGARELTLFRLGDLLEPHPGGALLASRWPDLEELAGRVRGRAREGVVFYKPADGDTEENLYLADYLGMVGVPVLPVASYPEAARVVFLGVQAAADTGVLARVRAHLARGGTLVFTPAFLRAVGAEGAALAGVEVGPAVRPVSATGYREAGGVRSLTHPLDMEGGVRVISADVRVETVAGGENLPLLTERAVGSGRVLVFNVRTFSEADFRASGEWLLAPRPLGWAEWPDALADAVRGRLLAPLGIELEAPAGVSLHVFGRSRCLYNFRGERLQVRLDGVPRELAPHGWGWWEGSLAGAAVPGGREPVRR